MGVVLVDWSACIFASIGGVQLRVSAPLFRGREAFTRDEDVESWEAMVFWRRGVV